MDGSFQIKNLDQVNWKYNKNPRKWYGEIIAFMICFNAFFYVHQINLGLTHYASAFKIPIRTVGVYYSKLLGLRTVSTVLGSIVQNYVLLYNYDLIEITTIMSFALMLIARISFALVTYTKYHLSLNVFFVLVIEAFFFGSFQISAFSFFPEYVNITNLSVEVSVLFVLFLNIILDTVFSNNSLLIIQIQNWIYLWFNWFTIAFYIHYVIVYGYKKRIKTSEYDCESVKTNDITNIGKYFEKIISVLKKLRMINNGGLEKNIEKLNGLHHEINGLKEINTTEIFVELDSFFDKTYEDLVEIENIVCVSNVLHYLRNHPNKYPYSEEETNKYKVILNKLKNIDNIMDRAVLFKWFYDEIHDIETIIANDEYVKKNRQRRELKVEIKRYEDIEKMIAMCDEIKEAKAKYGTRSSRDNSYIDNFKDYLIDLKRNVDDLKNIKGPKRSIQKKKIEDIDQYKSLIKLLKNDLPPLLKNIESLLNNLKKLVFDKYIKKDLFNKEKKSDTYENDHEVGIELNKLTVSLAEIISSYHKSLELSEQKIIEGCNFYKLWDSLPIFLLIIPAAFIYQFLFPHLLPFGLLKLKNSYGTRGVIYIIVFICKIRIYYTTEFEKISNGHKRSYALIWCLLIPKLGILVLSVLAVHYKTFTRLIAGSILNVCLMTMVMIICYTFIKSYSYIGVADYVNSNPDRNNRIGFLMSHNILAIICSYLFSKIGIGYNIARVKKGYVFPNFRPVDPINENLSFWIKLTISNGWKDMIKDLRMNIRELI